MEPTTRTKLQESRTSRAVTSGSKRQDGLEQLTITLDVNLKQLATAASTVRPKVFSAPPIHTLTRAMTAPIEEWLQSVLGGYESVKPSIHTLAEHLFEQEFALPRQQRLG